MTLTALEGTADEVPVDRDAVRRPLGWRAALWSVVSVRWAPRCNRHCCAP